MMLTPDPMLTAKKGYSSIWVSRSYIIVVDPLVLGVDGVDDLLLQRFAEVDSRVDRLHLSQLGGLQAGRFLGESHRTSMSVLYL